MGRARGVVVHALGVRAAPEARAARRQGCPTGRSTRSTGSSSPGSRPRGSRPSPRPSKTALIRRVTLDLTGLPPTLAEVDAFLTDRSEGAYETVVDRLLESPRYGEHMARFWLDAARYGDTHGLHLDNYREIWPYRDWVIRAFNDNKPFDRFVIEQLAGDLLPNPTLDQIVATGFNRCHVSTSEGGSIEEEVYVRNIVDQVDTNGTVFLGLSTGCAGATTTSTTRSGRRTITSSSRSSTTSTAPRWTAIRPSGSRSSRCRPPRSARPSRPWTARSRRSSRRSPPRPPGRPPRTIPSDDSAACDGIRARRDFVWIDDALPPGAKPRGR